MCLNIKESCAAKVSTFFTVNEFQDGVRFGGFTTRTESRNAKGRIDPSNVRSVWQQLK